MEIIQACFIIIDITTVAEGVGGGEACAVSGYSMTLIVFYGNQRSPRVIVVGVRQAAVLADDLDYIALNVLDVVIHGVVARKRNRAVAAVIVEMQSIITLYHGYQVVSGIIIIMSIALLCTHTVDVVLPVSAPAKQKTLPAICLINLFHFKIILCQLKLTKKPIGTVNTLTIADDIILFLCVRFKSFKVTK